MVTAGLAGGLPAEVKPGQLMSDTSNSYILSVFQAAGLCAGPALAESVLTMMQEKLARWGLKMTRWEPITQAGCSALLIYAESHAVPRLNLLDLRRELAAELSSHQLQLRIQREDLFLAMHRL